MSWEGLDPHAETNPEGLTASEIAEKWRMGESQTRVRLKQLHAAGKIKRVTVMRMDGMGRRFQVVGWVIVDGQEENKG